MSRLPATLWLTCALSALSAPAFAQTATGVGTGIAEASSSSQSGAVAISTGGGGGSGGNASLTGGNASIIVNNPAQPSTTTSNINQKISGTTTSNVNQKISGTTTQNVNQRVSGTTTSNVNQKVSGTTTQNIRQSGTTTANINQSGTTTANQNVNQNVGGTQTIRSAPAIGAPGLNAAGLETCLGAVSGGGSVVGFGATFGTTVPDPGCAARLDARTLWSMGLKEAAVARLCLMAEIYRSMPAICDRYTPPQPAPPPAFGFFAAAAPTPLLRPLNSQPEPVGGYAGGPVEVLEQRTGQLRTCNDYDATRGRCRTWARTEKVAAAKAKTRPIPAVAPMPRVAPATADPE